MMRRPPGCTLSGTIVPDTTSFRSHERGHRHHVGPSRWRVVGVFMRLDEHRRTTDCNGGAGKHRHEAAFATTAGALAAGLLDRMGRVEHYRIAGFRHDWQ